MSCKGRVFKADVSHCRTKKGVLFCVRLNELKRKSCSGCPECGWIDDSFGELSSDWPILGIEKAEHGKLYRIGMTNISRDYESGWVDDYDLELIELEEE